MASGRPWFSTGGRGAGSDPGGANAGALRGAGAGSSRSGDREPRAAPRGLRFGSAARRSAARPAFTDGVSPSSPENSAPSKSAS